MAKKKMCEICGENPATVPDRERMGRPINRLCSACHGARLRNDMRYIMECHKKRLERQKTIEESPMDTLIKITGVAPFDGETYEFWRMSGEHTAELLDMLRADGFRDIKTEEVGDV